MKFYSVRIMMKAQEESANGKQKVKTCSEQYLVYAVSCTDAEAIVNEAFKNYTMDWEIKSIVESKIVDIFDKSAKSLLK